MGIFMLGGESHIHERYKKSSRTDVVWIKIRDGVGMITLEC